MSGVRLLKTMLVISTELAFFDSLRDRTTRNNKHEKRDRLLKLQGRCHHVYLHFVALAIKHGYLVAGIGSILAFRSQSRPTNGSRPKAYTIVHHFEAT